MQGKLIFESREEQKEALGKYGIKESETAVLGDDFSRISRPVGTRDQPLPIIFWTKDTLEDNEPAERKVVRVFDRHNDLSKPVLIARRGQVWRSDLQFHASSRCAARRVESVGW